MPTEPVAVNEFIADLETQWIPQNVDSNFADNTSTYDPTFIEVTGTDEPFRFNLHAADAVVVRAGNPALEETPVGNWKYGNRSYNIEIEIHTNENRQRLYNLMREVRRIVHARRSSLTNFHRIRFGSFQELTQEQANVWTGTVSITLENSMVLLETT
tara:strand:+ start:152 stop:622 length:471 start_codon:yes stop_codon:yes gene_type:complete